MLKRFRLEEPQTVAEVADLLARFGDNAKLYAGGTELLLAMKEGLVDYERLINVKNVKGLNSVDAVNGHIKIGALCTHHQLETSSLLKEKLSSLVKLEENVANVRVRQAGTIGGNLCFADPHSDPATFLLACDADALTRVPAAVVAGRSRPLRWRVVLGVLIIAAGVPTLLVGLDRTSDAINVVNEIWIVALGALLVFFGSVVLLVILRALRPRRRLL